ncbi:MAG TPA: hypothetical protein VGK74_20180 [Symbiobacteriaceae bacterium]|jgi:hypothetical protein
MMDRRWWGVVFSSALLIALSGCSGQAKGPAPEKSPSASPTSSPIPAQQPDKTSDIPADSATACRPLKTMEMNGLVAKLTDATREEAVQLVDGEAREIFQQEAAAVAQGWSPRYINDWQKEIWKDFTFEPKSERTAVMSLVSYSDTTEYTTRFELTCSQTWRISRIGVGSQWFTPIPRSLPGQSGDLTPELAMALVKDAALTYGTFRMSVSATGKELERGRQYDVAVAGGASRHPTYWNETATYLELTPQSTDRVIGKWSGDHLKDSFLFVRVDGLWKVADYTTGGQWGPARLQGFSDPRPIGDEKSLLGIRLGEREREAPLPNNQLTAWIFMSRGVSVYYDADRRVREIGLESGASQRGLKTGDTVETVRYLYGQPTEQGQELMVYANATQRFEVELKPDAAGVERVWLMTLKKLPQK